jgi:hypothetical protein
VVGRRLFFPAVWFALAQKRPEATSVPVVVWTLTVDRWTMERV